MKWLCSGLLDCTVTVIVPTTCTVGLVLVWGNVANSLHKETEIVLLVV